MNGKQISNVAIVGAGIGSQHLGAYLNLKDRFNVACICDLDEERTRVAIEENGADENQISVEESLEKVLEDEAIELVDICLPPHLHVSSTLAALKAGKHVICEKPIASSLADVDLLQAAQEESGKQVFPVFQYRYGPALLKLRRLIEEGFTGKPLVASIETHWNRGSDYYAIPWRGTWKGEQGGAVLGHAIHNHDLLCNILGPIRRLYAIGATRVNPIETEDCASISMEMANGALATSSITLGSAEDITRLRFCFEHLTVESDLLPYTPAEGKWRFSVRGERFQQSELNDFLESIEQPKPGFTGFLEAVSDSLMFGDRQHVSLEDGRASIELVTAIYASMRFNQPQELPLNRDHPLYHGWLPDEAEGSST